MTQRSFKRFIENILVNAGFDVPKTAVFYNFNDLGNNWCKDWTTIFKKILNDIKAGLNYNPDKDSKAGNCVVKGPLSNRIEWLAVYFQLDNMKYNLYMIKLETPEDVFYNHFHSLKVID